MHARENVMSNKLLALVSVPYINDGHPSYLAEWLVKEGDATEKEQPLFELEVAKAALECHVPIAGKVHRQLVGHNADVKRGQLIGIVGSSNISETTIDAVIAAENTAVAGRKVTLEDYDRTYKHSIERLICLVCVPDHPRKNGFTRASVDDWQATDGAEVKAGEPLLFITENKSITELESPINGKLRRQVKHDVDVKPGAVLGIVASEDIDESVIDTFLKAELATLDL